MGYQPSATPAFFDFKRWVSGLVTIFTGCGLWVVGCGLWVVGYGLWVVGCG